MSIDSSPNDETREESLRRRLAIRASNPNPRPWLESFRETNAMLRDFNKLERTRDARLRELKKLEETQAGTPRRQPRPLLNLAKSLVSLFPASCMDDTPSVMVQDLVDKWSEEITGLLGKVGDVLLLGVQAACARIRTARGGQRNLVENSEPIIGVIGTPQLIHAPNLHDLFVETLIVPQEAYTDTPLVLRVASQAEGLDDSP